MEKGGPKGGRVRSGRVGSEGFRSLSRESALHITADTEEWGKHQSSRLFSCSGSLLRSNLYPLVLRAVRRLILVSVVAIISKPCNFTWFYFLFYISKTTRPLLIQAFSGQPLYLVDVVSSPGSPGSTGHFPGDSAPGWAVIGLADPALASRGTCEQGGAGVG